MEPLPTETRIESHVPHAVLSGSDEARLSYFASRALTVEHANLTKALEELYWAMQGRLDQTFITLIGPSGVGKTTAIRLLVDRLNRSASRSAIAVEVQSTETGVFDWRGFYVDILTELQAPFPDCALDEVELKIGERVLRTIASETFRSRPSVPALKRRVLRYIAHQGLQLLAIDEAINFLAPKPSGSSKSGLDNSPASNPHILKSLVNKSSCTMLFAGAYDLFDHIYATGQQARRGETIHFRRYSESDQDILAFAHAFTSLISHFPAEIALDPQTVAADVFEQSIGAVGNAKNILHRALKRCLRDRVPLSVSTLKQSFFEKARYEKLKKETLQGEELLKRELPEEESFAPEVKKEQAAGHPTSHPRKVGERNPSRSWQGGTPSVE